MHELGSDDTQDTLEEAGARGSKAPAPRSPFLFVILEADRPLSGGARYALEGVDEVVIARGRERAAERVGRRLTLRLEGRTVSAVHARLVRKADGWTLEDAGSTNGCYVNGDRVSLATLAGGDVLELGRTFLALSSHAGSPSDLDSREEGASWQEFPTLLPELATRLRALGRVATSSVAVLITGETGTGKEVLARAVHRASGRSPLVAVNCAALTESLAESQLFGHVRGAFSGATSDALGFVRAADGGTLLLDEVQDLRPASQAALLRVVQESEVVPVGSVRPVPVDVRFVAVSGAPLERAVQRGTFRPDLFARLSGYGCALPPVRARLVDLGVLVAALLAKHGVTERDRPRLAPALAQRLFGYHFPLNVRELEQFLRRAWLLASDGVIDDDAFPARSSEPGSQPGRERVARAPGRLVPRALSSEDAALRATLVQELGAARGNVAAVARKLGKAPVQIRRWITRFGIDLDGVRRS